MATARRPPASPRAGGLFDQLDTEAADARLQRRLSGKDMVPLRIALAEPRSEAVLGWCARLAAEPLDELLKQPAGDHLLRLFLKHDLQAEGGLFLLDFCEDAAVYGAMRPGDEGRDGEGRDRAAFAREVVEFYFVEPVEGAAARAYRGGRRGRAGSRSVSVSSSSSGGNGSAAVSVSDSAAAGAAATRPRVPLLGDEAVVLSRIRASLDATAAGGDPGDSLLDVAADRSWRRLRETHYPLFLASPQFVRYAQVRELCARRRLGPSDFSRFRVLGAGAFGEVSAMSTKDTRQVFAVKKLSMPLYKSSPGGLTLLENEWRMLERVRRMPFATPLRYAFRAGTDFYVAMPFCSGGDLRWHLRNREDEDGPGSPRGLGPARALFYAAELLEALRQLHAEGVAHRDVKPGNALLHRSGHITLSDFAFAEDVSGGRRATVRSGTPHYMAPEVAAALPHGTEADVWSWAVTAHCLFAGRPPPCRCRPGQWCTFAHEGCSRKERRRLEREEGLAALCPLAPELSDEVPAGAVRELLSACLQADPARRPTCEQALASPAFASLDRAALAARELPPPFVPDPNEVYASTLGAVGEPQQPRGKVGLSDEELAAFDALAFSDERACQEEMAEAMRAEYGRFGPMPEVTHMREMEQMRRRAAKGGGCCDVM